MTRPLERAIEKHNVCSNYNILDQHQAAIAKAYEIEYGDVYPYKELCDIRAP
jgi:hypothetical protein